MKIRKVFFLFSSTNRTHCLKIRGEKTFCDQLTRNIAWKLEINKYFSSTNQTYSLKIWTNLLFNVVELFLQLLNVGVARVLLAVVHRRRRRGYRRCHRGRRWWSRRGRVHRSNDRNVELLRSSGIRQNRNDARCDVSGGGFVAQVARFPIFVAWKCIRQSITL